MNTPIARRWLAANIVGSVVGFPLFGVIADGLIERDGALDIPMHLAGFLAFAAILSFLQRRAIGARHTSYALWTILQAVGAFLAGGLGYLAPPPVDFVANVVALGAITGFLLRREILAGGGTAPRLLVLKGAGAGLASLVGMVPVFLVAESVDRAFGSGMTGFAAILTLIGLVSGTALGVLLRVPAAATTLSAPVVETASS